MGGDEGGALIFDCLDGYASGTVTSGGSLGIGNFQLLCSASLTSGSATSDTCGINNGLWQGYTVAVTTCPQNEVINGYVATATNYITSLSFTCGSKSSNVPTLLPTYEPSYSPSYEPTYTPTYELTYEPSYEPYEPPTYEPTLTPTDKPTATPSRDPPPVVCPPLRVVQKCLSEPTYEPFYQPPTEEEN